MNILSRGLAALGVGAIIAVAAASPAFAHTGDLHVTATCNTATGQYDFHSELVIGNAGATPGTTSFRVGTSNFDGTPSSTAGMTESIPVTGNGTYTLKDFSLPGNTTGLGPWVYAYTVFTNGVKVGSDGQLLQALKGDCRQVFPKDASVAYSITPATCTDGAIFNRGATVNASFAASTTADGFEGPGNWSVEANADAGHLYANGSTKVTDSGTLAGPIDPNDPACRPAPPGPKFRVLDTETLPTCQLHTITITHTEERSDPVWNTTTHAYEDGPWTPTGKVIPPTTRQATAQEIGALNCKHDEPPKEVLAATNGTSFDQISSTLLWAGLLVTAGVFFIIYKVRNWRPAKHRAE